MSRNQRRNEASSEGDQSPEGDIEPLMVLNIAFVYFIVI